jgi:hypothetical protein
MNLHVIYRSVGAENAKPRPPCYAKLTSLYSFLRAREACPAPGELLFLNDGPIPPAQLATMRSVGEIVPIDGLELHLSYWKAIDLALARGWADDDIVYLGEDDYLYRREVFTGIRDAADRLPANSYLAPYATIGHDMPNGASLCAGLRRPCLPSAPLTAAGGAIWHRALSPTSSFAVRVGALRADRALHLIAPRTSGAWDHAVALAYQGRLPFAPHAFVEPLRASGTRFSRRVKTLIWRLALSAGAVAARRREHLLAAPRPALATHMETAMLSPGTDWAAEDEAALLWGDAHG